MHDISRRAVLATAGLAPLLGQVASAQTATPRQGGTLNIAQCSANRRSASPQNARHPYFLVDATTRLPYGCLVWVNRSLQLEPELAERWAPADETLAVWDVTLRDGLVFHDGTPVTARDVVASFEFHRTRSPFARQIERIEAVDRLTARFFLDAGNAEFPFVLGEYDSVIMPAAPPETIGLSGIGCGPYRIVSTDPNRSIVYERFDRYWRPGLPLLDRITLHNREGQQDSAIAGLRSGQFDVVMTIDPQAARQLARDADLAVESGGGGHHYVIQLPKAPGTPFLDKRVRQALAHAVDREAIVRLAYGPGQGWVSNDSHLVAADPNFLPRPSLPRAQAVARARALLAEAGHPNGINLGTLYWSPQTPEAGRYFQVLQETVREAGITIALEQRPNDGYVQFRTGDNDLAQGRLHRFAMTAVGPRNPGISLFRMRGANVESGHWRGPEHDRYMELYRQAMVTREDTARRAMFHDMQRILHEEVPALLPAGAMNFAVRRRNVQGFEFHPQIWSVRFDEVWRG
jgi:peptide/nickel transport system substrate-binding protein